MGKPICAVLGTENPPPVAYFLVLLNCIFLVVGITKNKSESLSSQNIYHTGTNYGEFVWGGYLVEKRRFTQLRTFRMHRTPLVLVVPEVHLFLLFFFVRAEWGQTRGSVPVITPRRLWWVFVLVSQQPDVCSCVHCCEKKKLRICRRSCAADKMPYSAP